MLEKIDGRTSLTFKNKSGKKRKKEKEIQLALEFPKKEETDAQNDDNNKNRFKITSQDINRSLLLMIKQYRISAR